jgi:N-carbamoylputrescine amidase
MKDLRIAAVMCRSHIGEIRRNLDNLVRWVQVAKGKGAELICFPELNLTGYCTRLEITPPAISFKDPIISEILQLATSLNIVILTGLVEAGRHNENYISHLVIPPNGKLGVYRKLHMAPPEKDLYSAGENIPVFKAAGITFGIQLCYDAHFPELSARMTQLGAEVIFFPHASPRGSAIEKHHSWMRHLPARAYDNSVFVVACNQVGDNCNQLTFPGNALVIGPSGELIEKSVTGREGLLLADLKAKLLDKVRRHPMRHFFPNRRPELYH